MMRALCILLILSSCAVMTSKYNIIFIVTLIANRLDFSSRNPSTLPESFQNSSRTFFSKTFQQFRYHQNLNFQAACEPSQEALRHQKNNNNYLGDMNNSISTDKRLKRIISSSRFNNARCGYLASSPEEEVANIISPLRMNSGKPEELISHLEFILGTFITLTQLLPQLQLA